MSAPPAPESRRHLHVEPLRRDLSDELTDRLRDGGVALVVRNTVGRAQETFRQLSEALDCEVVLVHSRFLTRDRAERERDLVTRLGPRGERPHRLVVVGTQVVEQSLDIDVDLLVTDLAPIDLLVQRIGRLHRHRHRDVGRPEPVRRPTVLVDCVDGWDGDDPVLEDGARQVYDPALLLSSLAVLRPALGGAGLTTPDEVPDLVGQAYAPDPPLPQAWRARWSAARAERDRQDALVRDRAEPVGLPPDPARTKDLDGWSRGAVRDQQLAAGVRDGEDSVEVVVVRRVGRELRTLGHLEELAEREIGTDYPPPDDLAEQVARCTLRLPHWLSTEAAIGELEQDGSPGWQLSPWLVGQLPLVLDEDHHRTLATADLRYTPEIGLVITRLPTERT